MELLEQRNEADIGLGVGDPLGCGSVLRQPADVGEELGEGLGEELGEGLVEETEEILGVGCGEVLEERGDAVRCRLKITTSHNLQLRMANHTARDVYVRLLGHGEHISGTGLLALKDSVHLSPLKPSTTPTERELEWLEGSALGQRKEEEAPTRAGGEAEGQEEDEEEEKEEETSGVLTISELVYNPCASMLPTPVDDGQGGVDLLFQSPIQSPARLLRELHADPDIQAQLVAERVRDRAFERARVVGRSMLGSGLRLLTRNERVNTCVLSAVRLIAMVIGVLLVAVPMLLLLLESDIDVSFLHEIRQTPEFEQFHYEYYCPLRRWILCKISMAMERLGWD